MKEKSRFLVVLLAISIVAGLGVRFAQAFRSERALCGKPFLEDSYYALTIARNIALGNGITYDGKTWTNGFQPAVVFLQSLVFRLAGEDRLAGVHGVMWLQSVLALVTALVVGQVGGVLHDAVVGRSGRRMSILLCMALWLGSYSIFIQDMNGLETGLYFCSLGLLLLVVIRLAKRLAHRSMDWLNYVFLSLVGAWCMYVRNDAVFVLFPLFVWLFFVGLRAQLFWKNTLALFVSGCGMIALFSPWLVYNLHIGGSIVPISGAAESVMQKTYGWNLKYTVSAILDYVFIGLETPISGLWFSFGWTAVLRVVLVILLSLASFRFVSRSIKHIDRDGDYFKVVGSALLVFALGWLLLVIYYTCVFFAWWMFRRYFAIVYVVLVPLVSVILSLLLQKRLGRRVAQLGMMFYLLVFCVYMGDLFTSRRVVPMYHFVQFCKAHVPEGSRVAAWQTGVLGYFWDGTINLDGKVNPDIQRNREAGRNTYEYIATVLPDVVIDQWAYRVTEEPATRMLYSRGPKELDYSGQNRIDYEVALRRGVELH